MDQCNRIDSPEISPQSCGQLIFSKGTRIHNVKKKVSSANGARKTVQMYANQ